MQGQRDDAADTHFLRRLGDAPPIEPDMSLFDQRLGKRPALHHANEE
jgi:hypothetical protein